MSFCRSISSIGVLENSLLVTLSFFDIFGISLSIIVLLFESGAGILSTSVSCGLGCFLQDFLSALILLFLFHWERFIVHLVGKALWMPTLKCAAIMCQQVVVEGQLEISFGFRCTLKVFQSLLCTKKEDM